MKTLPTIIFGGLLLASCATVSGEKNKAPDDTSGGILSSLGRCASSNVPEGVLALGFAATVPSPMAPLAAAGYYSSVMYKCKGSINEENPQDAKLAKLRKELSDKIEASKTAAIKSSASQINDLSAKIDSIKASEAENMNSLKSSAAKIASETDIQIKKSAGEAIQSVYRQMDEVRKVKIQVIEDNDDPQ